MAHVLVEHAYASPAGWVRIVTARNRHTIACLQKVVILVRDMANVFAAYANVKEQTTVNTLENTVRTCPKLAVMTKVN